MEIKIDYDGKFPVLCFGKLSVTIDGREWKFPSNCLSPGGQVGFDEGMSFVKKGPWEIDQWPKDFPEILKLHVIHAVNEQVEWGNCGGCL